MKHSCKPHSELLDERIRPRKIDRKLLRMPVQTTEFDENKRVVTRTKMVEYDPAKTLNQFSVNDFSITSLNAVGADMHFTSLSVDNHTAVSQLKESINHISNNKPKDI